MNIQLTKNQQRSSKLIMHSAAFCGRVSMLAFVLFLLIGPFDLIEIQRTRQGWFFWDLMLSSIFFAQHSAMIRQGVRARMARFIPTHYHGAIFTLASSFVLIAVVLFWQSSGIQVVELSRSVRWIAYSVWFLAAAGIVWGVRSLKQFDPFGRGPIKAQLAGKPLQAPPFTIKGPYLLVRHPLYFFVLVMIWAHPNLTADRLVFNLLWSGWIYLGTRLEEKDLVSELGDQYKRYQKEVPMLIPWKGLKANKVSDP